MLHHLLRYLRNPESRDTLSWRAKVEIGIVLFPAANEAMRVAEEYKQKRYNESVVGKIPGGVQWQYLGMMHHMLVVGGVDGGKEGRGRRVWEGGDGNPYLMRNWVV